MSKKTEPAARAAQAQEEWAPPAGAVTYIGPDIDGVAARMTSYRGGLPGPLLAIARERCKALRGLIVPVDSIAAGVLASKTEGTAEHALYRKAEAFAKGEG